MLTEKKEAFARAYHETGNASEAYRRAYNAGNMNAATVRKRASELLDDGDVTGMLEQLKAATAKRHTYTVDSLSATLEEAIALAKKNGQVAAIVSAVTVLGKLNGLIVEKREDVTKRGKHELSDAELEQLIASAKRDEARGPRVTVSEAEGSTAVN